MLDPDASLELFWGALSGSLFLRHFPSSFLSDLWLVSISASSFLALLSLRFSKGMRSSTRTIRLLCQISSQPVICRVRIRAQ